ncbi:GntR family transcriptional regulator [Vibrio ostreae]|uniref:GntR family transcriptional regulator n=1 Tax=Vibrio ostreae TaxID=2841925 RepID=A0A975YLX5_9VIBR|nr:GntR family transcriptional regulator [Vibrio ostreae]QXO16069.1 GntR family transcriptional regulator [Vibrio ostreae]
MSEHPNSLSASLVSDPSVPLADSIRIALSDDILAGVIAAGTRLDEAQLAQRFQVSRTPVREALKQLTASGLVEHRHRRGVFVSAVPVSRLAEMFEYVAEMETLCVRLAAVKMTQQEREELLAIHLDSHKHVTSGNIDAYDKANIKLHEALFHGCHNRYVEEAVLSARAKVAPYRRAQFKLADRARSSFVEHGEIVKSVIKGMTHEASDMMLAHIHQSFLASSRYVSQ